MNTARNLFVVTALAASVWAQPDLFFNQGALVHVQANALVYVQGGYVNNDQGAWNQGTYRTTTAPSGSSIPPAAGAAISLLVRVLSSTPTQAREVYLQGDFTNDGYYRAGTRELWRHH
jgi:hypothetical protein